jgi:signal transduction histidine kinase
VIQRLFAIGLSLQGTTRMVERPEAVLRIADAIDKIDETIRQLRKAIFDIELTINKEGLHPKVLDLLHELRPVLDFPPQVALSGPVDRMVTGPLVDQVLAVLREALTNVGKHAEATQVVVTIAAGDELRLVVADDGIGVSAAAEGSGGLGLKNMRQRAERLGGGMEIGTSREGGTRLTWHVPLQPLDETIEAGATTNV